MGVQVMDGTNISFEDNTFDVVFSYSSIEHFGSKDAAAKTMQEIERVLKPGGVLSLTTEVLLSGDIYEKEYRERHPHRMWARNTLHDHKRDGCDIQISLDELTAIAEKSTHCPYCGVRMLYCPKNIPVWNSPTLDRRDNENVIRADNIDIICLDCNKAKVNWTKEEFVSFCRDIVEAYDEEHRWITAHE